MFNHVFNVYLLDTRLACKTQYYLVEINTFSNVKIDHLNNTMR